MYVLYFSLIVVRLLRLALGFVHNFSAKWNEIHQINQANIRHNPRDNIIKATRATQVTKSSTASSSGQPRPACSSQRNSHLAPQRPVPPTSAPECERHPRQTLNVFGLFYFLILFRQLKRCKQIRKSSSHPNCKATTERK